MIHVHVGNSDERVSSHFSLCDLTNGHGVFYISKTRTNLQYSTIDEESGHQLSILSPKQSIDESLPGELYQSASIDYQHDPEISCHLDMPVTSGVSFVAGHLEFCLTALPLEDLLRLRMFSAASSDNLPKLKSVIKSMGPLYAVDTVSQNSQYSTPPEVMQIQGDIDINSEYSSPSYGDESYFDRYQKHSSVTPPSCISPSHKLLLHIAIGNRDIEMTTFLLEKGADVSLKSFIVYATRSKSSIVVVLYYHLTVVCIIA